MSELVLRMADGTEIVLPSSLNAITTYVILEQEKWFEKETAFLSRWLKHGMTAIDVGANLGVYSLPMARLVGPNGHVFAYEPASETRRLLRMSKKKNRAANLHIIPTALSDGTREGHLVLAASSELNTLAGNGPGERVQITSLDAENTARNWERIDFLKIDAEGEEEKILAGADAFFARHSPLVMFEVKAGDKPNEALRTAFATRGFGIYRLLRGAPILVPIAADETLDQYELNLFAAKPEQAASLAREGLLVETVPLWQPDDAARAAAFDAIRAQAFGPAFASLLDDSSAILPAYRDALAAYAAWRSPARPLPERVAALRFASDAMVALCQKEASLARLSTLARAAWEFGNRAVAVNALRHAAQILRLGTGRMVEPFWPAQPRFDTIAPGAHAMEWFVVAVLEQFEFNATFSSLYGTTGIDLDWLCGQPFVSTEIERRRTLLRARSGQRVNAPPRLLVAAPDHLNASSWRGGLVPNVQARR